MDTHQPVVQAHGAMQRRFYPGTLVTPLSVATASISLLVLSTLACERFAPNPVSRFLAQCYSNQGVRIAGGSLLLTATGAWVYRKNRERVRETEERFVTAFRNFMRHPTNAWERAQSPEALEIGRLANYRETRTQETWLTHKVLPKVPNLTRDDLALYFNSLTPSS